jgi:hypothetical protein
MKDGHRNPETFFSHIQFKIMNINLQISDSVYKALLAGSNRIQGSIGLVSPTEGNFNAHRRTPSERPDTRYIKLAHGRASVTEERVSLTLRIDRRETDVVPCEVIDVESQEASDFVYANS